MARKAASTIPVQVVKALENHLEAARAHLRSFAERHPSDTSGVELCERIADGKGRDGDADRLFRILIQCGVSLESATDTFDSAVMVLFLDAA